jgi:hypothetical protein
MGCLAVPISLFEVQSRAPLRVVCRQLEIIRGSSKWQSIPLDDMDLVGVLRALKAVKFREVLALEYEENPKGPLADIRACLVAVQGAVARM